jgi:uncharacterized protein YndB with AHSA1/START domain
VTEPLVDPQQRVIDLSVSVPGTPEEVWRAIATGPGISSWFVPHEVEQREGGLVTMSFGAYGTGTAEVTAWQPPHRLVFSTSGERPMAYEWLVEARDGGTCVVRLVNSGFGTGDDWDDEYDGMTGGWTIFLANLRLHLTHFPGQSARPVIPVALTSGPHPSAFAELCSALGVPLDLTSGDAFTTAGADAPALVGTVAELVRLPMASAYLVVLDAPAPGTGFLAAEGRGEQVTVSAYLYLYGDGPDGVRPDAVAAEWTRFFGARFPMPLTPTGS